MRNHRMSEWAKGKHDLPLIPSLFATFGVTAFFVALLCKALLVTPVSEPVASTTPDLSTFCYAYGGLYNLNVTYANGNCYQDYQGTFYPIAYKELLHVSSSF